MEEKEMLMFGSENLLADVDDEINAVESPKSFTTRHQFEEGRVQQQTDAKSCKK